MTLDKTRVIGRVGTKVYTRMICENSHTVTYEGRVSVESVLRARREGQSVTTSLNLGKTARDRWAPCRHRAGKSFGKVNCTHTLTALAIWSPGSIKPRMSSL